MNIEMTTEMKNRVNTNTSLDRATDAERILVSASGRSARRRRGTARAAPHREIYVTDQDRRRLEAMIEDANRAGTLPDYLIALRGELERARIVEATGVPHDVVTMNSTASLRDLESDDLETYTLVYPTFADARQGRISVLAPVGTALLGCRVGDVVEWPVPAGAVRFRVEAVLFQPERAGAFDL